MRLLRYGDPGRERPGLIDRDGVIRSLETVVRDIDADALADGALDAIADTDTRSLPPIPPGQRIGPCVGRVGKIVCIGLNYRDHAAESGSPIPEEPIVFLKATSAICGPNDALIVPRDARQVDWEIELGVVIGKRAQYVEVANALDHVVGYCAVNDVSERHFQLERGGQWTKGKSADSFAPIGPWLVTPDEIADVQDLSLWLEVDGVKRQSGSTRDMIFGVAEIVSYVSGFMTLMPGDVVSTGTPAGVGWGFDPPVFLKPGNTIRAGIAGLGEQEQNVIAFT